MNLIFNELSIHGKYQNKFEASEAISLCMKIAQELKKIGFSGFLQTTRDFQSRKLCEDFSIYDWCHDLKTGENRDLKRIFLMQITKIPYIDDVLDMIFHEGNILVEARVDQKQALGAALAYLEKNILLSLPFENQENMIDVEISKISNDNFEWMIQKIPQIYSLECINNIENHIRENQKSSLFSFKDFMEKSQNLFPYLRLGEEALNFLQKLNFTVPWLSLLWKHFEILNKTMQLWESGFFSPEGIDWSTESSSTMQQFGSMRIFSCYDGKERQFHLHSKIMGPNIRIYFEPVHEDRCVHIGYVGGHLPTTKFKT